MKLWRETGKNTKKGNKNGEMSNPQKSGKNRQNLVNVGVPEAILRSLDLFVDNF